ncbi:MAG: isoprenoid biosynthesis glyoxalase ElbB [Phycisphaerales bacterium]
MAKNFAVVLCGSGRSDGSEITEAVSTLVHLSRLGLTYRCFAPDAPQTEIVNHATGKLMPGNQSRNMMVESARISRGEISPITSLLAADFDAVVFPGGNGLAKNLCDFASKGAECVVMPDVERVIREFHAAKKGIGLICIAPVLAARVLGARMNGPGCKVTIGSDAGAAGKIAEMGSTNVPKGVGEAYLDEKNRVYSTPAYMYDAKPHEVFEGIGRMIEMMAR